MALAASSSYVTIPTPATGRIDPTQPNQGSAHRSTTYFDQGPCGAVYCLLESSWSRPLSSCRPSKWRDGRTRAWALATPATAYHNLPCDPYPGTRGEEISRSKRTAVRASSLVAQYLPGPLVPACQPPVVPPPRGAQVSETKRVSLEIASLALGPASQGVTHEGRAWLSL